MDDESRMAWEGYRRRRRLCLRIALGGIAVIGGLWLWSTLLPSPALMLLAGVLFVSWGIAQLLSGISMVAFDCPRCHQKFFSGKFGHNAFARRCMQCTLPLGGDIHERLPLWWHNPGEFEWPERKETPAQ